MKKRLGCALLLVVVAVVLPNRVPSAAQNASGQTAENGAPPLANPLKVALLRWYKANTVFTMFPVGKQPYSIAFDGASDGQVAKSGDFAHRPNPFPAKIGMETKNAAANKKQTRAPLRADRDHPFRGAIRQYSEQSLKSSEGQRQ